MSRVAFLGAGAMGSRMARRLLDAGHDLTVWNRTPARTEPLLAAGAAGAASPAAAAADAELAITMLTGPDALREVTEGPSGLAAGMPPGGTVVDMSTVGPGAVTRLRDALPGAVGLLDAPVLGTLPEAESGSLHVFVGGPDDLARRWIAFLSTLGTVHHVGPLGAGAAAKLVANSTLFGVLGVLGEALALADGLGLSRATAFDVLTTTAVAAQAEKRRPSIESGEYPPRFSLALARKDADLVANAADEAGLDLRLAAAARSWLADAQAAGLGGADYSAVLAHVLSAAGKS
jgi:3-hydroxyisobutyrate dehydrogenase/2-hydroxy-3-oxopropionate reductase